MKILYDHQMFTMQKFGGITRYFRDLMLNLPSDYEYELPIRYSENFHLQELSLVAKHIDGELPFRVKRQYYYFQNNSLAIRSVRQNRFDIFHPTYYNSYFLKHLRKPFVITIHDLTHERFNDTFLFYDRTASQKHLLVQKADHIIVVSENTKKDLVELYHVIPDKISVVYHGYQSSHSPESSLFENYILYVGERKGYKNFYLFIEAIIPLLKKYSEIKVVCTGKPFNKKERTWLSAQGIESQIVQKFASDVELSSLYKYALMFVYPSLYEGFGIPILEAFHNNCPVCLSNASCFPEIASDAACYFNPLDKDSIYYSVKSLIENKALANDLRLKGQQRLKMFSIDKMVNNTCKVYDMLSY